MRGLVFFFFLFFCIDCQVLLSGEAAQCSEDLLSQWGGGGKCRCVCVCVYVCVGVGVCVCVWVCVCVVGASGKPDSGAARNRGGMEMGGVASEFPDTAAGGQTVT